MISSKLKITFIGAGKMATAIAGGLVKSKLYSPDQFMATDNNSVPLSSFVQQSQVKNVSDNNINAAKASDVVILAVKPQQIEEVGKEVSDACKDKLVISIAAGVKLDLYYRLFGHKRIIRVMPNTPMMVCLGASAFSMGNECKENDKEICQSIFSTVGKIYQVEEQYMDAVTGISGSGPAYVYQFIKFLTDAGIKQGLDPQISFELATQTVLGAATMVSHKQGTPDELTKAVTSPNGTTYAALCQMEKVGFKSSIDQIVQACVDRSIELGGGKKQSTQ